MNRVTSVAPSALRRPHGGGRDRGAEPLPPTLAVGCRPARSGSRRPPAACRQCPAAATGTRAQAPEGEPVAAPQISAQPAGRRRSRPRCATDAGLEPYDARPLSGSAGSPGRRRRPAGRGPPASAIPHAGRCRPTGSTQFARSPGRSAPSTGRMPTSMPDQRAARGATRPSSGRTPSPAGGRRPADSVVVGGSASDRAGVRPSRSAAGTPARGHRRQRRRRPPGRPAAPDRPAPVRPIGRPADVRTSVAPPARRRPIGRLGRTVSVTDARLGDHLASAHRRLSASDGRRTRPTGRARRRSAQSDRYRFSSCGVTCRR